MSWNDQIVGYYYPSYQDELYHHGIKGMQWGVRRYRNDDGSLTSAGKKRYEASNIERLKRSGLSGIGSSQRVRDKQKMFEAKIKKTGDSNIIARNFINDRRRGRIAELKTKAEHREAKEAYTKNRTKENLNTLRQTRKNRAIKNGLLSVDQATRGRYNRYRKDGNEIVNAAGKAVAVSIISTVAVRAGRAALNNYLNS